MESIYTCPNCGETKNLHFNYDYSKQHRPVKDVLCNMCGEFFDGDMPAIELSKPYVSDNFQIGPDGAYEHEETSWNDLFIELESQLNIYIPIRVQNYVKNIYNPPIKK